MTAAVALAQLTAAGIRLEVRDDALLATPREALTDDTRALIRGNKNALVLLLSEPRRLWLVTHMDGRRVSHSFCPPATLAEVRGWYPTALGIEPEDEPPVPMEPDTRPAMSRAIDANESPATEIPE